MKKASTAWVSAAVLGLSAPFAVADSISPETFMDTLNVGESVTIKKVVTVSEGKPTSSKVDVFFLADTTGSMGSALAAVQASAGSILGSTSGLGDVAYAVGFYNGEASDGDTPYGLVQSMTTNTTDVQNAINTWSASGGGDIPESNLYGLERAASDVASGWRVGSERILVWFGDAPGHDPSPDGIGPSTEATATAALVAAGINVQAVDIDTAGFSSRLDDTGQATRITAATGGDLYTMVDSTSIAQKIEDAINETVAAYTMVGLDLSEVPVGVTVTATPNPHVGDWDRSEEREFGFEVTFTGDIPGHYEFPIYGTVDGGRVATEKDVIWVNKEGVPDGGQAVMLFGLSLCALGAIRRKIGNR